MRILDLRLRITAAIAVVCVAIVAALGITLYQASERMELALVEQLVTEEMDFLIRRYEANPAYVPSPGPNVEYYIIRTTAEQRSLPEYLRSLDEGQYEIYIGDNSGESDVVVREVRDVRFIVVYNIGPYEEREQDFRQLVVLALLTVICLALILGYFLSGVLTRQLTLLAQRVATLVPGQPYSSLLKNGQDREVAMLAKAFDQYHALFLNMIKREQEFTANVSHELRTPLTAIRTSCELLAEDPALSEKSHARIRYINHAVNSMTNHIQALLFLAREQEFKDKEPIALLECVEDVHSHFREEISRKGLACTIGIPPDALLTANRQALQLVLTNLFKNAVMYTDSGFIHIGYATGRLTVSNSGVGIPVEQLPRIFARNYRGVSGVDGHGLGLDIVKKVCNQADWNIEVSSVSGKSTTFSVTF